jgi:hypothetical protein
MINLCEMQILLIGDELGEDHYGLLVDLLLKWSLLDSWLHITDLRGYRCQGCTGCPNWGR